MRLRSATSWLLTRVAIAVAMALLPTIAHAVSIELKDVAADRIERQRAAAEGSLPLPGTPDLARKSERLEQMGLKLGSPILIRTFKSESELEVWVLKGETYVLFATYPVCHWSGTLGPKLREGDKQTPEGFYTVSRGQLRTFGRWPRSLHLGFPNAYDRSFARTGSVILIHGGCSSVGCFAMTNSVMEEVYGLAEAAIDAGQLFIPVHVFPFRMTDESLASQIESPWFPFWRNLKEGFDYFEAKRRPPKVATCDGRYTFSDIAPEEGAVPGPLAVCGATVAALSELEQLSPAALLALSMLKNPAVEAPRSLPAHRHLHKGHQNRNAHASAGHAAQRGTAALSPPPCSIKRASCRHYLANRSNAAELKRAASRGRKVREARR